MFGKEADDNGWHVVRSDEHKVSEVADVLYVEACFFFNFASKDGFKNIVPSVMGVFRPLRIVFHFDFSTGDSPAVRECFFRWCAFGNQKFAILDNDARNGDVVCFFRIVHGVLLQKPDYKCLCSGLVTTFKYKFYWWSFNEADAYLWCIVQERIEEGSGIVRMGAHAS